MKPGGQTIYYGPLGDDAHQLVEYFQSIDGIKHIKPRYNPANWMLEMTTTNNEEILGVDFAQIYAESLAWRDCNALISKYEESRPFSRPLVISELHVAPWRLQFTQNFRRLWLQYRRMPEYNFTRLIVTIGVACVFGMLLLVLSFYRRHLVM